MALWSDLVSLSRHSNLLIRVQMYRADGYYVQSGILYGPMERVGLRDFRIVGIAWITWMYRITHLHASRPPSRPPKIAPSPHSTVWADTRQGYIVQVQGIGYIWGNSFLSLKFSQAHFYRPQVYYYVQREEDQIEEGDCRGRYQVEDRDIVRGGEKPGGKGGAGKGVRV